MGNTSFMQIVSSLETNTNSLQWSRSFGIPQQLLYALKLQQLHRRLKWLWILPNPYIITISTLVWVPKEPLSRWDKRHWACHYFHQYWSHKGVKELVCVIFSFLVSSSLSSVCAKWDFTTYLNTGRQLCTNDGMSTMRTSVHSTSLRFCNRNVWIDCTFGTLCQWILCHKQPTGWVSYQTKWLGGSLTTKAPRFPQFCVIFRTLQNYWDS